MPKTTTTTRQRTRAWCLTINNPNEGYPDCLQDWYRDHNMKYLVAQKEKGAEGTEHIQLYVSFENPVSFSTVKTIFTGAHIEAAKGSPEDNKKYCTKEETRIAGPWEYGELPVKGKRNDLMAVKADLDEGMTMPDLAEKHFSQCARYYKFFQTYKLWKTPRVSEPKTILILWGPTGTGKTRYCFDNYPNAYWKTKSNSNAQFWDGYNGEDTIIIDEFYGWLPFEFMLRLTDRYPVNLDIKHGTIPLTARTIIFTSNKHPRDWYPNIRYQWDESNPLKRRVSEVLEFPLPSLSPGETQPNGELMESGGRLAESSTGDQSEELRLIDLYMSK